ncbi:MAG: hypothetical protein ACREA2_16345 [Blastocatellia bacterium]
MEITKACEEIINFIAAGASTESVAAFKASPETRARVAELIGREKTVGLTPEEQAELDSYEELEHIMILAKARAHKLECEI